jgi:hypothetical protein
MPNNQDLIRERLGALGLPPQREEEILRELGEHVEDSLAALEAGGILPEQALRDTLDSVSDWPELRKRIVHAETAGRAMNCRTRALWVPALSAIAMSSGLLALVQHAGIAPHLFWVGKRSNSCLFFAFYFPWLILLPLVGAVSAFLSDHAGSKVKHRLLAALAPALGMLGFIFISPLIALAIYLAMYLLHRGHAHGSFSLILFLTASSVYLANWVLLPAIGLLMGAAPFLRKGNRSADGADRACGTGAQDAANGSPRLRRIASCQLAP